MLVTVSDFPAKGSELTGRQIVALARLAEEVGIDRFAVSDFPFYRDCVPLMTACLEGTTRLQVESLVTTPFRRPPDVTACTWATMADLSGGRTILGIGKGGVPVWAAPWGHDRPNTRVAVRELIEICRTMWAGIGPWSEGATLRTSGRPLDFPARHRIPILVAARGPEMLAVGARHADIVHIASPFLGPSYLRDLLGWVNREAQTAGRADDDYEVDITVSLSALRDGAHARRLGKITTAAAIVWVGGAERDGKGGQPLRERYATEFGVPDRVVQAIAHGWEMWSGEPLPDELADLISPDILSRFTIAGEPDECRDQLRALLASVDGFTGLRFKLPAVVGPESYGVLGEMVENIGGLVDVLATDKRRAPCQ